MVGATRAGASRSANVTDSPTITPDKAVVVKNATDNITIKIEAEKPHEISGDDWVDVYVAGFGSLRASGPEGNADEHRSKLNEAVKKIESLTQPYSTSDPDKLQGMREHADKLEQEINNFENRIEDILGEDAQDALKQEQIELQARVAETEKTHPVWKNEGPQISKLQSDWEGLRVEVEDAITEAENAFEQAQARHAAATNALNGASADLKVAQGNLGGTNRQIVNLLSDRLSDDERAKAISDALMSWQAAKRLPNRLKNH